MKKLDFKEEFFNYHQMDNDLRKGYITVFNKIESLEKKLKKDIKDFNYEELLKALEILTSKSYNAMSVKWSILKRYLEYYKNDNIYNIDADVLRKFVQDEVNIKRYITRKNLEDKIKNLPNPQDKAILLLIFEGVMGKDYLDLRTLNIDQIDIYNNTITLSDKKIEISPVTSAILEKALVTQTYFKSVGEDKDMKSNDSFDFNMDSDLVLKSYPSKRNNDGKDPMSFQGLQTRLKKILAEIELYEVSGITLYHSGLIEKLFKQFGDDALTLSISQLKKITKDMGATKIQPSTLRAVIKLYKESYL